jgi:hypothetical protein
MNDEFCVSLPSKQVPNNECDNASESSNSDIGIQRIIDARDTAGLSSAQVLLKPGEIECDENNKNKTKFIIEFPNFY